jgi:hypothetical protein
MTADPNTKSRLRLLGLGALACIGCCAGPLLAFLGGLSVAGLASTTVIGGTGLVVAAAAAGAYRSIRLRRTAVCDATRSAAVSVAAPTRRESADPHGQVPVP